MEDKLMILAILISTIIWGIMLYTAYRIGFEHAKYKMIKILKEQDTTPKV